MMFIIAYELEPEVVVNEFAIEGCILKDLLSSNKSVYIFDLCSFAIKPRNLAVAM